MLESSSESLKLTSPKKLKLPEISAHKSKILKIFISNFEEEKENADPYVLAMATLDGIKSKKAQASFVKLIGLDGKYFFVPFVTLY